MPLPLGSHITCIAYAHLVCARASTDRPPYGCGEPATIAQQTFKEESSEGSLKEIVAIATKAAKVIEAWPVAEEAVNRWYLGDYYIDNIDNLVANGIKWMKIESGGYELHCRKEEPAENYRAICRMIVNNYLSKIGKEGKYNVHIELSQDSADKHRKLLLLCPAYPVEKDKVEAFWLSSKGTTLRLSKRQVECYSADKLQSAVKDLPFPDVYEAETTTKGLKSGEELPELKALILQNFETVIVWF
ncbi:hypothetical protein BDZ91DRAFT_843961 [Kalaharituber pfeilii]|nr:hypothetical protein BDZ91DRAFT_843961 [Kalaharituber pfeilii]